MIIFIRRVNGEYQICRQRGSELTVLAERRTWNQAEAYAELLPAYRPGFNAT